MSRGLIARQDAVDAMSGEDDSEVSVVDVVDGADVESDLIDAAEEEAEIRDFEEDLDKAETAVESMEALIDCLNYTIEQEGGLTKGGAMLFNLANNMIHQQMGDKVDGDYSSEDYSDSTRLEKTQASLEGVKDTLASWWKAIKKFFSDMWNGLKNFLSSIFSATERTIKRAEKVKKAAKEVSNKWKDGKLTEDQQKRFGKKMVIDSNCKSLGETSSQLNKIMDTISDQRFINKTLEWGKAYADYLDEYTEDAEAKYKEYEEKKAQYDKDLQTSLMNGPGAAAAAARIKEFGKPEEVKKLVNPLISSSLNADRNLSKIWNQGDDGEYFRTDAMPGNMALCIYIASPKSINAFKVGFMQIVKPNDKVKFTAFPTFKDVSDTCDNVVSICEKRKKAGDAIKTFGSKMDTIFKLIDKHSDKAKPGIFKRIVLAFRNLATSVTRPFTQMAKYSVTVSKTMLDLCVIGIKEAGKKEKDKKDK